IDDDFGNGVPLQPALERRKVGFEIDAAGRRKRRFVAFVDQQLVDLGGQRRGAWLKSRSRAVNTRIGSPMRTRMVGPIWPFCCNAVEAAFCPPPTISEAPPLATVDSPPITDSSIAEPKRLKKWLPTCPGNPPLPSNP